MVDKEDIESCLLEYPEFIQSANKTVLNLTEKVEQQRGLIKELVLKANSKVSANPALKNELQRKTELDSILKSDLEYQEASKKADELNYTLAVERIDLEYLQNMFHAYRSIAGMVSK